MRAAVLVPVVVRAAEVMVRYRVAVRTVAPGVALTTSTAIEPSSRVPTMLTSPASQSGSKATKRRVGTSGLAKGPGKLVVK